VDRNGVAFLRKDLAVPVVSLPPASSPEAGVSWPRIGCELPAGTFRPGRWPFRGAAFRRPGCRSRVRYL
jgi:hypothetical protein